MKFQFEKDVMEVVAWLSIFAADLVHLKLDCLITMNEQNRYWVSWWAKIAGLPALFLSAAFMYSKTGDVQGTKEASREAQVDRWREAMFLVLFFVCELLTGSLATY